METSFNGRFEISECFTLNAVDIHSQKPIVGVGTTNIKHWFLYNFDTDALMC